MIQFESNSLIPLVTAAAYAILLVVTFVRRSPDERLTRWLSAFLAISIGWQFLVLISFEPRSRPDFSIQALLVSTTILSMMTSLFADWPKQRQWLALGAGIFLVGLLGNLLAPTQTIILPRTSLPKVRFGSLLSHLLWLSFAAYLLFNSWRAYRSTLFPWHANRLLFWVISLFLMLAGEGLTFFHWSGLTLIGQILRFIGVVALTYAISSHRVFDVRTRSKSMMTLLAVTMISGAPLATGIFLVQWAARNQPTSTNALLSLIAITVGLLLYQPFHRSVEKFFHRYVRAEGIDTSKIVRRFSQAAYRTLDVNQLSLVIIGTLSELLAANRGALMLVTETYGGLEIEPIPVMGNIPRRRHRLPTSSPFVTALVELHQPLLQYEIDFNPYYANISPEERTWLKELAMEVYVPISTGTEIVGLIAIGPKNSGVPYQPGELELTQILADQTVIALQNSRLFSELAAQNEKIRHLNVDLLSQNERLEIMDRVKSDFITIASHELRTPLTQVKGYADILDVMNEEQSISQEQTRGIVGHINRAAQHLEELITAMLDASEIDVEGVHLTLSENRLDVIMDAAIEPLSAALQERRINMSCDGSTDLPPIQSDFNRLVQAFTNIIGNALKYTPDHGSIEITAAQIPSPNEQNNFVEVTIADTGIGIDTKFHELIFEKFFRIGDPQLHSTGSTKFLGAGPGLGLPIAKGVVEAHGGKVWVESDGEDKERLPGSRFHVVLPTHPPQTKASPQRDPRLVEPRMGL